MLDLDDPRWKGYYGEYRLPYDASVCLRRLSTTGASPELWAELWNELHHQGDVDAASYAAVPYLVDFLSRSDHLDWNALGLIFTVEFQRPSNPAPPAEIVGDYFQALEKLPIVIVSHPQHQWDEYTTRLAVACIALLRGNRVLAATYFEMDAEGAQKWLTEEA